jgi:hypothetical protein
MALRLLSGEIELHAIPKWQDSRRRVFNGSRAMLFEVGYNAVDLKWFVQYSGPQVFGFVVASAS